MCVCKTYVSERACVFVRESKRESACESERERKSARVCARERERESETEYLCESERERERVCMHLVRLATCYANIMCTHTSMYI